MTTLDNPFVPLGYSKVIKTVEDSQVLDSKSGNKLYDVQTKKLSTQRYVYKNAAKTGAVPFGDPQPIDELVIHRKDGVVKKVYTDTEGYSAIYHRYADGTEVIKERVGVGKPWKLAAYEAVDGFSFNNISCPGKLAGVEPSEHIKLRPIDSLAQAVDSFVKPIDNFCDSLKHLTKGEREQVFALFEEYIKTLQTILKRIK